MKEGGLHWTEKGLTMIKKKHIYYEDSEIYSNSNLRRVALDSMEDLSVVKKL